ncbi:MAG: penicillin-binding protein 2 [Deltaproteobacteria bacterium]|nr:penicillin-binding protein 2 [Deltaproteobacteria bacterium]
MRLKLDKNGTHEKNPAFGYANIVIIVAFSLLFSRLGYLQIFKGEYFKNLSENNRIRIQEIAAPRGIIYDRAGIPLVDSFPSFDVSLFRQDVSDTRSLIPVLSRALSLSPERLQVKLDGAKGSLASHPLKLKANISREELAMVETRRLDLPGVMIDMVIRRNYPYENLAAHLIGYLGEISQEELEQEEFINHKIGYFIGKYGIEYKFELDLKGENGGRQIEVNALGRKMRVWGQVEPNPGNNLFLTLDIQLQKAAEEAMMGKKGALVAMDPQNGDILALVSKPDFDPNLFARGISPENWKRISENSSHPLQNRAIQGQYPPGSVYKIIMAIAGLEEKMITPETTFHCSGALPFGNRDYLCWKKEGHGRISLRRAIVESCDVYFYNLGLRLGVDRIAKYAMGLGLGRVTGFPLGHEKPGLIPTSSWKMKRFGIPWQAGENLSIAIGQGFNLVTPLQVAYTLSALANGGKLYRPRIVQAIKAPHGEMLKEFPPDDAKTLHISPETLEILREALWGVVNSPGGTGGRARIDGFDVAGKTGTAQVVQRREGRGELYPAEQQDHAWFVCFAPARQPQITVVALIEHGGHGGAVAAPVAKKVLENYYLRQKMKSPSPLQIALRPSAVGSEGR